MKKLLVLLSALALVFALGLITGCGEKGESEAEAEATAEAGAEAVVAKHDCDGGCGMKDVAMDQLTEIEGKFYCAGCAKKVQDAAEGHEGHDHPAGESHGDG